MLEKVLAPVVKFTVERPLTALGIAAVGGAGLYKAGEYLVPKAVNGVKGMLAKRAAKKMTEAAQA